MLLIENNWLYWPCSRDVAVVTVSGTPSLLYMDWKNSGTQSFSSTMMTRTCELVKDKIGRWEPRRKAVMRRLCHINKQYKQKERNLLICSVCLRQWSSWFTRLFFCTLKLTMSNYIIMKWVWLCNTHSNTRSSLRHPPFRVDTQSCVLTCEYDCSCTRWQLCVNSAGIRSGEVKWSSVILQQRSATDIRSDLCKSLLLCLCVLC